MQVSWHFPVSFSHDVRDVLFINMNSATDFPFGLPVVCTTDRRINLYDSPNIVHAAVKLWQSLISVTHHINSMFRCFWNNFKRINKT